jgi:DNA-binding beta-propeller fold protein YncE
MSARTVKLTMLASLCVLAAASLLCSASALAVRNHVFGFAFGSAGTGPGQLTEPSGVAVNDASGEVYVVDKGDNRVEDFGTSGTLIREFDASGANPAVEGKAAPTGRLSAPEGIAIDNDPSSPSFGDVYVDDKGNRVIDKFSEAGKYLGQLTESSSGSPFGGIEGIATDADGKLWVCQPENQIDTFSSALANEFISEITSTGLSFSAVDCPGFAVDSNDDLYVRSYYTGIGKLNSSGQVLVEEFDSLISDPIDLPLGPMTVDLSNDEVYIGNADTENSVGRFTSSGAFLETFGSEHLSDSHGIAVDAKTGEVYVADGLADRVDAFPLQAEGPPTIESEGPTAVTGASATLTAQLKPTGPDTTYYFQYGATSCAASPVSCSELPAAPGVDLGGGFESQNVSVHLQGLQPATAYHFRAIAVNDLGTSEGSERIFTTQSVGGEALLPDGRLWEMVTPPDKYGSDLIALGNEQGDDIQTSANGDAITFGATSPFALNPAGSRSPEVTQVLSRRVAPGQWETADITTPNDEGASELETGHSAEYKLFSSDLSVGLVEPAGTTALPPLPAGSERTIYLRLGSGEYRPLVSAGNVPPGTQFGDRSVAGLTFDYATPDLSHVVLSSRVPLTAQPLKAGSGGGLYEWAEGHLQLASVLPGGEGVPAQLGGRAVKHEISDDGSRLVFVANGHDYLRDMPSDNMPGGATVQIDAAQGTPEPAEAASHFVAADRDDSRIFFTSERRLTANSTAAESNVQGPEDLYEFQVSAGSGEPPVGALTDLTVDGNSGESADVLGVMGASEDGSYVYFAANGLLGDAAQDGAKQGTCERASEAFKQTCNLYVLHYDEGTKTWAAPKFIATLSGADRNSWGAGAFQPLRTMTSGVSPNGRYLTFMSERSLTGYDNRDAGSGVPDEEVFLYDYATGRVVCASCNPTGARPAGIHEGIAYEEHLVDYAQNWTNRWFAASIPGWTTESLSGALYQSRYLSNSGRLFFDSSDALVPADVNGTEDVYEYEPAGEGSCQGTGRGGSSSSVFSEATGGCVALISSGTSTEESAFMDASEGGGDVFFLTLSRLAAQDVDTSLDLYDAHECTASSPCAQAAPLAPPPCTTGDACKAAPTPQPAIYGAPSSETFSGAGNVVPTVPASSGVTARSTTRAQKLTKALKACAKKPKRQRAKCEKQARRKYAARNSKSGAGQSAKTGR